MESGVSTTSDLCVDLQKYFFDPPWRRGFHLPSRVPDVLCVQYFLFDALIIFYRSPPNIFFGAVNIFLMRHPNLSGLKLGRVSL